MITKVVVKKSTYRDSITLMKVSNTVAKMSDIEQAAVVMATELNRRVLSEAGFVDAAIGRAAGDDMIVAVQAKDAASLTAAFGEVDKLLAAVEKPTGDVTQPTSIDEALVLMPDANLVVISVPGQFAKREAMEALSKGLNVFLFSSNVSRDDEVQLKRLSKEKNLLMMGPDCGTSIISHKVLGFGNVIREGTIGLVSASGTGLQEVTTLVHKAGLGVSQAIGTGGGDLSEEVGGITMVQGIRLLESDTQTRVIVLISKPPNPRTMNTILSAAKQCKKPVVVNFLGANLEPRETADLRVATTLEDAAALACRLAGKKSSGTKVVYDRLVSAALDEHKKLSNRQLYVRGLFGGGTLCYESQCVLGPILGNVYSNAPIDPAFKIPGDGPSKGHACIDMGAEEFVEGRAHPMIDFGLRKLRILKEAADPESAVVLLDVELGYGSNPDPAGELVPVIEKARVVAKKGGRYLSFVASVVGTEGDSQGLSRQEEALSDAGVLVLPSNAEATRVAALVAAGDRARPPSIGRNT